MPRLTVQTEGYIKGATQFTGLLMLTKVPWDWCVTVRCVQERGLGYSAQ